MPRVKRDGVVHVKAEEKCVKVAKEKADHNCRLTSKFVVTGTRG